MSTPHPADNRVPTHRWRKADGLPSPHDVDGAPKYQLPEGDPPPVDELEENTRRALHGWPVAVLRLVGTAQDRHSLGRSPGRWLRAALLEATYDTPAAPLLSGQDRQRGQDTGWGPLALHAAQMEGGRLSDGDDVRCEVVLAGRRALHLGAALVEALEAPPDPDAKVHWTTVRQMVADEDGELMWRRIPPRSRLQPLALDQLQDPPLRRQRLMVQFPNGASLGRTAAVLPDLSLIVDRMGRTLVEWMRRTGHDGPLLPVDDLVRATRGANAAANHTQLLHLPVVLLGEEPPAPGATVDEQKAPLLAGSATWTGDFSGLGPLLRAAAVVGVGPGREYGLGETALR